MSLLALSFNNPTGVSLALVPLLVNLAILVVLLRRGSVVGVARAFAIFVAMLSAWQFFDVTVRAATNAETAAAWRDLLRAGQFFAVATGVHFALRFARMERAAESIWTYIALYLPPLAAQALYAARLIDEPLVYVPIWGWIADTSQSGPLFDIVTAGFALQAAAIPAILYGHAWKVRTDQRRFPIAQLLAVGITVPVVLGVLTEALLPLFFGMRQIPITSTTLSAFSLAAAVGLQRNRMFQVDTVATAQEILESISDALMVFDPDGRVRFANAVAREQLNVSPAGRSRIQELLRSPREAKAFLAGPWARALTGRREHGLEMTLVDRHQHPVECLVSVTAIRQGAAVGLMMVAHDISELRDVEAELALARERIEEARGTDGPWIAHLSDELRHPLNTILGCVQLMSEGPQDQPVDAELLQRMEVQGNQLLRLLSDVIDISQIDAGELPLTLSTTELTATIRAMTPICRQLVRTQSNRLDIRLAETVDVQVDPARLRQIVLGVITFLNSLGRQRTVALQTDGTTTHGVVRFSLPGVSLSAAQLSQALDHLPRKGKAKGPRLTLALCRRLCQLMGGDLTASADDQGTQLVARLPLATGPAHTKGLTGGPVRVKRAGLSKDMFFDPTVGRPPCRRPPRRHGPSIEGLGHGPSPEGAIHEVRHPSRVSLRRVPRHQQPDPSSSTRSCVSSRETVEHEGEEYPLVVLDVSSESHPFYTGTQRIMDTEGRVERFMRKYRLRRWRGRCRLGIGRTRRGCLDRGTSFR